MPSTTPLVFTVTFRGASHPLSALPESTLLSIQAQLEELTHVPPSLQKLLYKGRNLLGRDSQLHHETTLEQAGFKNGMKIQLLGSTFLEMMSMQEAESEQQKRERVLKDRALKMPVKLRSTGPSNANLVQYQFHEVTPLSHLPNPGGALTMLTKLSEDPAILHIMQQHRFSVGLLTELAPHEQPHLLGLNVNAGQAIKLRLRTDRYDGFRLYKDIRRVLCHELTHNVWGPHDNNFKELNSKLNHEVAEFERAVARGTHTLSGGGDVYEPSSEVEAEAYVHTLGGGNTSSVGDGRDDSQEERRRRILEATMARLRKEEEELENSCGTGTAQS